MKSQKDTIFEVIKEQLADNYSPTEPMRKFFGAEKYSAQWRISWGESNSNMQQVIEKLLKIHSQGKLVIKKELKSEEELVKYLQKRIFNWLNKDLRLNGGTIKSKKRRYKTPLEDEMLAEMLKLRKKQQIKKARMR